MHRAMEACSVRLEGNRRLRRSGVSEGLRNLGGLKSRGLDAECATLDKERDELLRVESSGGEGLQIEIRRAQNSEFCKCWDKCAWLRKTRQNGFR
jgi:hypothetical protein